MFARSRHRPEVDLCPSRILPSEQNGAHILDSEKVDQIRMIIDLKGATLKQITNKHLNLLWKEITKEISLRFPEFVHSVTVVNTPMFFEDFFDTNLRPLLTDRT